jgi:hypothetical protein
MLYYKTKHDLAGLRMNSFSHIIIGDLILRHISEYHGYELSQDAFIHGNMLPDFRTFYKTKPHEPESWSRYIQLEIAALSRAKNDSMCFGPDFSRRLGVICHFYADFFCFPHSPGFKEGSIRHFQYEWALHRRLRGRAPFLGVTDLRIAATEGLNETQIFAGFQALYQDYIGRKPSFNRDIDYTLRACVDLAAAVLANAGAGVTPDDDLSIALPTV